MALDEQDIEAFIARLHEDPQLRDRVRNAILADDFLALPGIVERLGERVDQLGERVEQLGQRMNRVEAQLERVSRQLERLVQAQERTEARLDRLDGRVSTLEGWQLEERYVRNLGARLGSHFRRARALSIGDLDAVYEAVERNMVTQKDLDDLSQVGLVAIGQDVTAGRAEFYIAADLSIVVDEAELERADRRANTLRAAGLHAVALVDGRTILPDAALLADKLGVRYWVEPRAVA